MLVKNKNHILHFLFFLNFLFKGKTTLIEALAKASGNQVVRINLSEQTDMMVKFSFHQSSKYKSKSFKIHLHFTIFFFSPPLQDLLGADLPVEGESGQFAWRDGIFLTALKTGKWVLLDELNLASQSVLEGLNSCLDHRATIYIPEIDQSFSCPPSFRIFACQNPTMQGGGRKGLPKSFLNRFTKVYIDQLLPSDLLFICQQTFPQIDPILLDRMISFNSKLYTETMIERNFGRNGSPWEFNLRDLFRWCHLMVKFQSPKSWNASLFLDLIYLQRMRSKEDRKKIETLYESIFEVSLQSNQLYSQQEFPFFHITPYYLQVGSSLIGRKQFVPTSSFDIHQDQLEFMQKNMRALENLIKCVDMNWMSILVGPTTSGKTSLVRLLSKITGNKLYEFAMNSSVDTTELLGGFEQIDLGHHKSNFLKKLDGLLDLATNMILSSSPKNKSEHNHKLLSDLHQTHSTFLKRNKFEIQSGKHSSRTETFGEEQYRTLQNVLKTLLKIYSPLNFMKEEIPEESLMNKEVFLREELIVIKEAHEKVVHLSQELEKLIKIEKHSVTGCFEWIDGLLINALEEGSWILIDNVNFCNPSVLDRLNPLLEPGGSLLVNERGLLDGEPKIIFPHKNFRIFFSMDPNNGEISRAMRNRGVEICLFEANITQQQKADSLLSYDTISLLSKIGIRSEKVSKLLIKFHSSLISSHISNETPITIRNLLQCANLTVEQLKTGSSLKNALTNSIYQVYMANKSSNEQRSFVLRKFEEHFLPFDEKLMKPILSDSLFQANLWPLFVGTEKYSHDSVLATILRQSSLSQYKIGVSNLNENIPNKKSIFQSPSEICSAIGLETTIVAQRETAKEEYNFHLDDVSFLYLIENCTREDWEERVSWLNYSLKNVISTPSKEKLSNYISLITHLMQKSNLVKLRYNLEDKLKNRLFPTELHLFMFQPLILSLNNNLMHLIKSKSFQSGENSMVELYNYFEDLQIRIEVEIKLFQEKIKEETFYRANPSDNQNEISCIHKSYLAFHEKLKLKESTFSELIKLVYPFFLLLDQQIMSWLMLEIPSIIGMEKIRKMEGLVDIRSYLWNGLNSTKFNLGNFLVLWEEICEVLKDFDSNDYKLSHDLYNCVKNVNNLIKKQNLQLKSTLWKHSQPTMIRNRSLFEIQQQLRNLDNHYFEINEELTEESPVFTIPKSLKKSFVQTYCTLSYVDQQILSSSFSSKSEHLKNVDSMKSVLESISQQLKEHQEKTKEYFQSLKLKKNEEIESEEEEEEEKLFEEETIKNALFDNSERGVLPFLEHSNLSKEFQLLSELAQFSLPFKYKNISTSKWTENAFEKLNTLIPMIEKWLESGSWDSLRSPLDFSDYQQLLWSCEESKQNNYQNLFLTLPSLFQSIVYKWHKRLWKNNFNDLSVLNTKKEKKSFEFIQKSSAHVEIPGFLDLFGASRIFQSLQTILSFYQLSNWHHIPLNQIEQKKLQLKKLCSHFCQSTVPQVHQLDWNCLFSTFASTISTYWKFWKPESFSEMFDNIFLIQEAFERKEKKLENVDKIIERIKSVLVDCADNQFREQIEIFTNPFFQIVSKICKSNYQENHLSEVFDRCHLWILLSLFRVRLLIPLHNVDPSIKYTEKVEYMNKFLSQIKIELENRKELEFLFTGRETNQKTENLIKKIEKLSKKIDKTTLKMKVRPLIEENKGENEEFVENFQNLFDEIHFFSDNFLKQESLISVLDKFKNLIKAKSKQQKQLLENIFAEEDHWQDKSFHLLQSLSRKYRHYEDVVLPFSLPIYQIKYALRLIASSCSLNITSKTLKGETVSTLNTTDKHQVKRLIQTLLIFPSISSFENETNIETKSIQFDSKFIISESTLSCMENVLSGYSSEEKQRNKHRIMSLIFRGTLSRLYIQTLESGYISKNTLQLFDHIFNSFVNTWRVLEEEKAEELRKRELAFEFKEKTHIMISEEEQEEKNFQNIFPDYDHVFVDLDDEAPPIPLEELGKDSSSNKFTNEERLKSAEKSTIISVEDQLFQICKIHQSLFNNINHNFSNAQPRIFSRNTLKPKISSEERIDSYMLSYKTTSMILQALSYNIDLDIQMDQESLSSQLIAANNLKEAIEITPMNISQLKSETLPGVTDSLNPSEFEYFDNSFGTSSFADSVTEDSILIAGKNKKIFKKRVSKDTTYNIYKDPNIPEAKLVLKPLEELNQRITELLNEWPEHPALELLLKISKRIMSFKITEPLNKFLTGLEFLLTKSQKWEEVAAKHVSLEKHLQQIIALIARWRKIELWSWPQILQIRAKQYEVGALKWWFHFYTVFHSFERNEIEEENVLEEKENKFITELTVSLNQFMENSTIGDFKLRLSLLFSFYRQLSVESESGYCDQNNQASNKPTTRLISLMIKTLRNLHKYYTQFLESYTKVLESQCEQLKNKFKDEIKLARWDTRSYYRIKEHSEKSKRKVATFARKFEEVLKYTMKELVFSVVDENVTKENSSKDPCLIYDEKQLKLIEKEKKEKEKQKLKEQKEKEQLEKSKKKKKKAKEAPKKKENEEEEEKTKQKDENEEQEKMLAIEINLPLFTLKQLSCNYDVNLIFSTGKLEFEKMDKKFFSQFENSSLLSSQSFQSVSRELFQVSDPEKRLSKLDKLYQKMQVVMKKNIFGQSENQKTSSVNSPTQIAAKNSLNTELLSISILQRMVSLQKDDVGKSEKKLALSQLLKTLKSIGLTFYTNAIDRRIEDTTYLLQLPTCDILNRIAICTNYAQQLEVENFDSSFDVTMMKLVRIVWKKSELYYYKSLYKLQVLKELSKSYSQDLTSLEVRQALGYCQYILFFQIEQRANVDSWFEQFEKLSIHSFNFAKLPKIYSDSKNKESISQVEEQSVRTFSEQTFIKSWTLKQKHIVDNFCELLEQYSILVKSVENKETQRESSQMLINMEKLVAKLSNCNEVLKQQLSFFENLELKALENDFQTLFSFVDCNLIDNNFNVIETVVNELSNKILSKLPLSLSNSMSVFVEQVSKEVSFYREKLKEKKFARESKEKTDPNEFAKQFVETYEIIISQILIAVQNLMGKEDKKQKEKEEKEDKEEEEEEEEEEIDLSLPESFSQLSNSIKSLKIEKLNASLEKIKKMTGEFCNKQSNVEEKWFIEFFAFSLLSDLHPLLEQFRRIHGDLIYRGILFNKATSKLSYILVGIFSTLFRQGYCNSKDEEEGTDIGEMNFEGTGMGEGKGKKDVSDQIEDPEEQLGGNKDEKQENNDEDIKEEEKGIEMENDFEAEMFDQDEKQEKNEEEEDEEEKSADREMGDIESEEENVVDEKLWDNDEENDDEEKDKKDEKFEKDAPLEDDGKQETETQAKQEEENEKNDKNDNDAKEKKDKENKQEDDGKKGEEEQAVDKQEEGMGDESSEEENFNPQDAQKTEENQVDMQDENEFEIPENLELEDGAEEGPEDMNLEDEGDDEDGDEGEEGEEEKQEDLEFPDKQENEDDQDEQKSEGDEKDAEDVQELQKDGEDPQEDEEKEKEKIDDNVTQQPYKTEQLENPFGVKDQKGETNEIQEEENEKNQQTDNETQGVPKENEEAKQDVKENQFSEFNQVEANTTEDIEKAKNREMPNPLRDLASALQFLKENLNVAPDTNPENKNENQNEEENIKEQEEEVKSKQYEFSDEKNENAQTLAPATEQQMKDSMTKPEKDEEAEEDDKEMVQEDENEQDNQKKTEKDQAEEEKGKQQKGAKNPPQNNFDFPKEEEKEEQMEDENQQIDQEEISNKNEDDLIELEKMKQINEHNQKKLSSQIEEKMEELEDKLIKSEIEQMEGEIPSFEEVMNLREQLKKDLAEDHHNQKKSDEMWRKFERVTSHLSQQLCEQLRLILAPTLATKLKGDYKSGKRINMKKIIPYIASQFKKDKIWMRRTKPNKRQYQIMLAIDDSRSMADNGKGQLALEALTTISKALSKLEVGEVSVLSFGTQVKLLHGFDMPFTDQHASRVISEFNFKQNDTNMQLLMQKIVPIMELAKQQSSSSFLDNLQLAFIISDGILESRGNQLKRWIREAAEKNILIVFILIDNNKNETGKSESVLDIQSIEFVGEKMVKSLYIDKFPFPYYIILRNLENLPEILADSLRQWFEMTNND